MRSTLNLRALALCGLLLGLMAFTAGTAQAEPNSHLWTVNPETGLLKDLSVIILAKLDKKIPLTLTSKIAGVSVVFTCTELELTGAKSEANGTISKGAKVIFTGCTTKLNGATSAACEPVSGGKKGVVVTKPGHALIRLDILKGPPEVKHDVIEVLPDEGEIFATIEMGEECSIGEKVNVIGPRVQYRDCENEFLVHKVEHLVEILLQELWVISKTAEHVATLGGSFMLYLGGEHLNLKWSIEPA